MTKKPNAVQSQATLHVPLHLTQTQLSRLLITCEARALESKADSDFNPADTVRAFTAREWQSIAEYVADCCDAHRSWLARIAEFKKNTQATCSHPRTIMDGKSGFKCVVCGFERRD